ncbi:MAG TPA: polysaccharide biosynthesis/export family protein [Bryobacteraceae bacterium]|nr:polysaccharide biosynthesis/export family protein [Bryobacteraceae bacterium]
MKTVLVVLSMMGVTLAAQQERGAPPPAPVKTEAPKATPGQATETASAGVDPRVYVVGPEDVLFIRVWREMDFTASYIVRPDGKITIPLVGDVQAAGLTPERLGEQLKQALSDFINSPDVTVTVTQVNSKKFFITGQVFRPGEFPLVVPTRVFDALSNAGGFRDFANKKKIVIIRGAERIRFNYTDMLKGKNPEQNIFMENGDTIVVP